jgi:E3 ubiquitin-protein ligase makorin
VPSVHHHAVPVEYLWNASEDTNSNTEQQCGPAYADILKSNLDLSQNASINEPVASNFGKIHSQEVCAFFLSGNCKFGSRCRYLHPIHLEDNTQVPSSSSIHQSNGETTGIVSVIECGICLEAPRGSMFGLLSHCNCKFCLSCIRNWRSDGVTVTKDQKQVRICPLCRQQSYFVVPSRRFVTGEEKDLLVQAYKASIEKIPCKYYHQDGHCPFGSSCFYLHESNGSKGTEVTYRNAGLQNLSSLLNLDQLVQNRRGPATALLPNSSEVETYAHEEEEEAEFQELLALTQGMQNLSYEG